MFLTRSRRSASGRSQKGVFRVFWAYSQKNRQKDQRDLGSLFFAQINGNFFIKFRNHNVEKMTKNDLRFCRP